MGNSTQVPPGPKGKFLTGNLSLFSKNPLGFLHKCSREYGDIVRIAKFSYLINQPELIEQILHNKDSLFEKVDPALAQKNHTAFSEAVMNSSGAEWQLKRRHLQPSFNKILIRENIAKTLSTTEHFLGNWQYKPAIQNFRHEIALLSMEVGSQYLFGTAATSDEMLKITRMVEAIMTLTRNQVRLPLFIPSKNNLRLHKARYEVDEVINRIISRYKKLTISQTCVLDGLLAEDESGNSKWIHDEIATMIMSGFEPMADALTWTCYLLALHPECKRKLVEEVDIIFSEQGGVSASSISMLKYTEAVIKESLRLYPPAWMTGRTAVKECIFSGYHVPKGVTMIVSPWVTHRDPRYFEQPDEYYPARWLKDNFVEKLPKYAYFPFGGGLRKCIGDYLIMTQMITIVASIFHKYNLRLTPDSTVTPYPALVLRPLGVEMLVELRLSSFVRSRT